MSGLHNKFPGYFYKRGNLFNTYLGHTEASPDQAMSAKRKRSRRARTFQSVPPKPSHEQLIEFIQQHATDNEAARFVELVSTHKGIAHVPTASGSPRPVLSEFVRQNLSVPEAQRYLKELQRRKRAGERLVRSQSPGDVRRT